MTKVLGVFQGERICSIVQSEGQDLRSRLREVVSWEWLREEILRKLLKRASFGS